MGKAGHVSGGMANQQSCCESGQSADAANVRFIVLGNGIKKLGRQCKRSLVCYACQGSMTSQGIAHRVGWVPCARLQRENCCYHDECG